MIYYVSKSGNDGNNGTASTSSFLTIQRAVNAAIGGDTVIVDTGTYRETVTVSKSGITIKNAPGAVVTVTGADVIPTWAKVGNVWQSPAWDLGPGNNQVFIDGVMLVESRWPDPGLDISRPVKAVVQSVSFTSDTQGTIVDSNLTQPDGYWNGANLHIMGGEEWIATYGVVNSYIKGKLNFTSFNADTGSFFQTFERLRVGNHYFLFGKPFTLQSFSQWFNDGNNLQLLLPSGFDPNAHVIEAKRRQLAFVFGDQTDITVKGINIFAASVSTGGNSKNILLDGISAKYLSQFVLYNQWWEPNNSGITFNGTYSTIQNSVIQYSAGSGVYIGGSNNTVYNNQIFDTNYAACDGGAIHSLGSQHLMKNNTIARSGRLGINHKNTSAHKILCNDISAAMLQTTDGGGIYTYGQDGAGAEIAYNRVYNIHSGGFHSVGIYFDNGSKNFYCHHNLTFDVDVALKLNHPANNIQISNNTWDSTLLGIDFDSLDMGGCNLSNNIFTKQATIASNATQSGNIFAGTDPQFVDQANRNYSLQPTTSHPQVGCFPLGQTPWTAGANVSNPSPTPTPTPTPVPPTPPTPVARPATGIFDATKYDAASSGIKLVPLPALNLGPAVAIGYCNNGEWVKYAAIDFGNGVTAFGGSIAVVDQYAGQTMEIRVDSISGPLVATVTPKSTGNWYNFMTELAITNAITGVHDLYFVFKGPMGGICNVKAFSFC